MIVTAVRPRHGEELSPRETAGRLVIRTGRMRGERPTPAPVMRMLREHDEQAVAAASA